MTEEIALSQLRQALFSVRIVAEQAGEAGERVQNELKNAIGDLTWVVRKRVSLDRGAIKELHIALESILEVQSKSGKHLLKTYDRFGRTFCEVCEQFNEHLATCEAALALELLDDITRSGQLTAPPPV